jgi:high-affinity Fe2+/Pb2+ permease
MISVAFSAYARGRREGTWSWPLFLKTLLGLWVLGAAAGVLGIWLGRQMGPQHALLATMLTVVVIAVGVVAMALWMRGKMRHDKR